MSPLQLISIFYFIFFQLLPPPFSAGPVAKPGCQARCGNLAIPYPFGVGSKCSLGSYFDISCNDSTVPPRAYLSIMNQEIIEINQTYIRIHSPYLISACYESGIGMNVTGDQSYKQNIMTVNFTETPYVLSNLNWLIALGCDDVVLQSNGSYVNGGCSAFCVEKNDTGGVGYCPNNATSLSTNGCCLSNGLYQAGGRDFVTAELLDSSRKLERRKLFPCSYAFILEMVDVNETAFSYPLFYLYNSTALVKDNWASTSRPPVVRLDWLVGAENCSQAKKLNSRNYACRDEKSVCVEDADEYYYFGRGYRCSCVQGYEDNPYLTGGCQG